MAQHSTLHERNGPLAISSSPQRLSSGSMVDWWFAHIQVRQEQKLWSLSRVRVVLLMQQQQRLYMAFMAAAMIYDDFLSASNHVQVMGYARRRDSLSSRPLYMCGEFLVIVATELSDGVRP
ncbi:hypothetical protein E2562_011297 [Oryza meyeriana var. granulata]|uniref:Uncharacterized protein n=1 Tax=Oryza meyeriana var. granulata TaxID=110450 RepID=A0A6G1BU84_9ORYZ|nr:hypothetical protein E2562_011297 [Oryza meyeriana var. granulata]